MEPKVGTREKKDRRTHAILWNFDSSNSWDFALVKEVADQEPVLFWAMFEPAYFRWDQEAQIWRREISRQYQRHDGLIFVFHDLSSPPARVLAATVDFHCVAPLDDGLANRLGQGKEKPSPYVFNGDGFQLQAFALGENLKKNEGYLLEYAGRFDYSVVLGDSTPRSYYQDPEMDIGN